MGRCLGPEPGDWNGQDQSLEWLKDCMGAKMDLPEESEVGCMKSRGDKIPPSRFMTSSVSAL